VVVAEGMILRRKGQRRIYFDFRVRLCHPSLTSWRPTSDPMGQELQRLAGEFATTHWSVILRAGGAESEDADTALEELCRSYWYPLYAYVRRNGHGPHDAQDLVQEFFGRFLERKYLRHADRNRGRFRTFLLSSLKNFLINEWNKSNRATRGGSLRILSLDEEMAESHFGAEPAVEQPPDALYDRGWAAILLDRALAALRAEFAQSGKQDLLQGSSSPAAACNRRNSAALLRRRAFHSWWAFILRFARICGKAFNYQNAMRSIRACVGECRNAKQWPSIIHGSVFHWRPLYGSRPVASQGASAGLDPLLLSSGPRSGHVRHGGRKRSR
jgi:DNA-directed RNA polymerase specialized sigma24 family protein